MPAVAAIDVGSNAIRLMLASVDGDRKFQVLHNIREPVRLGQDAFTTGTISEETADRAIEAFQRFRGIMDQHQVQLVRAVATSALREAANADIVVDRIHQTTNIELSIIGYAEEARLIHSAVAEKINLRNKFAMLIDIGGGSVEVTLADDRSIVSSESYKMGAVRLMQMLEGPRLEEKRFNQLVREYVSATQRRLKTEIGDRKVDLCVGTGGNIESLGDLRKEHFDKNTNTKITTDELDSLLKLLQGKSVEERVQHLRLRPDRADVIVPASIVLQAIVKQAKVDEIQIPGVGLKDGLLLDIIPELYDREKRLHHDQVRSSAIQMGRKYFFDEPHATAVLRFAVRLFDATAKLHYLDAECRLLLEVAALVHDIGHYVNVADHHKHAYYLLTASPMIGLNPSQMEIVANVVRYHRKSFPRLQHEPYKLLSTRDRLIVSKLAAILRMADSLDHEHSSRVRDVEFICGKPKCFIRLVGDGDMMLEKWDLAKRSDLFQEVFAVKLIVED